MNNLTTFERALLAEFESLAEACARSGQVSADTAERLSKASDHFSGQIGMLRKRQTALEERLSAVTTALNEQSRQTLSLIKQVNALLRERGN
ncbi:hypothetical protein PARU111607_17320 [Palleronia rufa]